MRSFALPVRLVRRSAKGLLDLLLPPRCLGCGESIGGEGELCPACWRAITFLGPPCCACCGLPFSWRKKWERDWDKVKFCSERCRRTGSPAA